MNHVKHIYPKISYSIFVLVMFWAIVGLLFISGVVQPSPSPSRLMTLLTYPGDAPVLIGICVMLIILTQSRSTIAIPVCTSLIIASAVYLVLKIIYSQEHQSFWQLISGTNNGFPSGHAINNASVYTMLLIQTTLYFRKRYAKMLLALLYMSLTLLAGISRIILSIHQPGDVLVGWLVGNIVAFLVFLALSAVRSRQNDTNLNR